MTTTIRIEEELYEKIVKLAQEDKRSINSEMIYILEKYVEEKENERSV